MSEARVWRGRLRVHSIGHGFGQGPGTPLDVFGVSGDLELELEGGEAVSPWLPSNHWRAVEVRLVEEALPE